MWISCVVPELKPKRAPSMGNPGLFNQICYPGVRGKFLLAKVNAAFERLWGWGFVQGKEVFLNLYHRNEMSGFDWIESKYFPLWENCKKKEHVSNSDHNPGKTKPKYISGEFRTILKQKTSDLTLLSNMFINLTCSTWILAFPLNLNKRDWNLHV